MIQIGIVATALAALSLPTAFGEQMCFLPSWRDAGPALAIVDPGPPGKGSVWIVDLSGALVARISGAPDEAFALGLAGGRDHDGDGACDLFVASTRGLGEAEHPVVTMFSGRTGEEVWSVVTPPAARVVHLAPLGDVDGDGYPDLCIALPIAHDHSGLVRICRGKDGATLAELVGTEDDGLGWGAVGIDDVDGDGIGDLALGSVADSCVRIHALPGLEHIRDLQRVDRERSGLFGASMVATEGLLLIQQSGFKDGAAFLVSTADWTTLRTFAGGWKYAAGMAFLRPLDGVGATRVLITELGKGFDAGGVDVYGLDSQEEPMNIRDESLTNGFGAGIVACGDVDRDGEPDYAVGAGGYPGAKVLVFSGRSGASILTIERSDLEAAAKEEVR